MKFFVVFFSFFGQFDCWRSNGFFSAVEAKLKKPHKNLSDLKEFFKIQTLEENDTINCKFKTPYKNITNYYEKKGSAQRQYKHHVYRGLIHFSSKIEINQKN